MFSSRAEPPAATRYARISLQYTTFYSCYSIEHMTLMIPCSGLSERIECNMTSEETFSDDIMTAVSNVLQRLRSVTDTPINGNEYYSISSEGKPESNVS